MLMNLETASPELAPVSVAASVEVEPVIWHRDVRITFASRLRLLPFRFLMKPLLGWMLSRGPRAIAGMQLRCASMRCPDTAGLPLDYRILGRVPGHVLGTLNPRGPVVLWLHGGAFVMPAAPNLHLVMVARMCSELGAAGFVPDYRLAPFNRFPAALDDCERAYRALLDCGYAPSQIVLGGDSAGANLVLGVLQRARARGLPMPSCAVALSPVTEMGRLHAPPSRHNRRGRDPLLPIKALHRVDEFYAGSWDASDPELSPLYMDCAGLPPMLFMASDTEILLDDTLLLAARAQAAGVETTCQIWPHFPHAFPLFEPYFPEVRPARDDIVAFARSKLQVPA